MWSLCVWLVYGACRGPWAVNQTWNGIDWDLWSFAVCKPLVMACPNTEAGATSACGVPNKAGMCQQFTDPRHGAGSFCVSSWNGTISANLDGDGERGLHVMYQPGDTREEFRQNVNMLLNIECDPDVTTLNTGDIFVMPPYIVRTTCTHAHTHTRPHQHKKNTFHSRFPTQFCHSRTISRQKRRPPSPVE